LLTNLLPRLSFDWVGSVYRHKSAFSASIVLPILSVVSTFSIAAILGRSLGTTGYGSYNFALGLIALTNILTLPGLINAVMIAQAQGEPGVLRDAIRRRKRCAFPAGLLLFALGPSPLTGNIHIPLGSWAMLCCIFPFYSISTLVQGVFIGREEHWKLARLQAVISVGTVSAIWAVVHAGGNGVMAAAAQLLVATGAHWVVLRSLDDHGVASQQFSKFGRDLSLLGILGTLEGRLDVVLLGVLAGPHALGHYALARTGTQVVRRLWEAVFRVVVPRWATQKTSQAYKNARQMAWWSSSAGILLTGAAALLFPSIFDIVFQGDNTTEAGLVIVLVAAASIALPVSVLESYFKSRVDAKTILRMKCPIMGGTILAMPVLAFAGGSWGVAFLRLAKNALSLLFAVKIFRQQKMRRS